MKKKSSHRRPPRKPAARKPAPPATVGGDPRYRLLFDRNLAGVFRTKLDGTILDLNDSFARILGYGTREEAMRAQATDFYLDPSEREAALQRLLREGHLDNHELRLQHKDGSPLWLLENVTLVDDEQHGPLMEGTVIDITEQKLAEERFRTVAETATCGIYIHDGEHLLYVNQALTDITGHSRAELSVLNPWDLVAPDYRDRVHQNFLDRRAGKRVPSRYEFPVVRKNGERAWLDFSTSPVTFEGRQAFLATVFDVTERKRTEERLRESEVKYRELYENAQDIILTTDIAGNVTSMNKAAIETMAYDPAEIHKLNVFKMVVPEHEHRIGEMLRRKVSGEAAATTYEIELMSKDRRRVAFEVRTRLIMEGDKPVGVQAIARDITERKLLEQQLRQAQKMEAVGRLAGGVAHDFNNLLMVIRGYTELLLDHIPPGSPARQNSEQILKAADRARSLTQQLLAFGRKQVFAPQVLDLNPLLREWSKLLPPLVGAQIELRLDTRAAGKVRVDPGQMEQVIVNLAVNASDAMPRGGKLTISTSNMRVRETGHSALPPGDYVSLTIADTGTGMDDSTKVHIFEPFFTTKEKGRGTGLGLSTVYGIIEQSGGYIAFDSEVGRGTAFHIHLPRVDVEAEDREAPPRAVGVASGSETILLVEDEEDVRKVTRRFLERSGYKVLEAANGLEALGVAQSHVGSIHLLLTDVIMPGMHGGELHERLLALRPHVKVLFRSGYTGDSLPMELNAEMSTFVQKPFTHEVLTRKVSEALAKTAAVGN